MITEKQLNRVNELQDLKSEIDCLIRSFKSRHVRARVGILSSYPDISGDKPSKPHDQAKFFGTHFKKFSDDLDNAVLGKLKSESLRIEAEISEYIGEPS